jgi:site-specific DNA-methyltransferase (adenine-specific)
MKNDALFTSDSNEWYTPQKLFDIIEKKLGLRFTLDPCATKLSAKCEKYYTKEDDGLSKSWKDETVFINPPYSKDLQPVFIKKAFEEAKDFNTKCVLLIPARTDTKIWHNYIFKYAQRILFIEGRIKFQTRVTNEMIILSHANRQTKPYYDWRELGKLTYKDASPFPSAIILFDGYSESWITLETFKQQDYEQIELL